MPPKSTERRAGLANMPNDMVREIAGRLPTPAHAAFAATSRAHRAATASRTKNLTAAAAHAGATSDAAAKALVRLFNKCFAELARNDSSAEYVAAGRIAGSIRAEAMLTMHGDVPHTMDVWFTTPTGDAVQKFLVYRGKLQRLTALDPAGLARSTQTFLRAALKKAVATWSAR